MLKKLLLLSFFCSFFSFGQKSLSTEETQQLKSNIQAVVQKTHSLKGNFSQLKSMEVMEDDVESSGNFFYKKPSQIKWEYKSPFEYSIRFLSGKILISENGKTKEIDANSNKLLKQLSELLSNSITGKLLESDSFKVNYYQNQQHYFAILIPKEKELKDIFTEIKMHFDERYLISKIQLTESGGDETIISFSEVKMNPEMNSSIFETP
ncbi:LolA family protein [Mesonia maritima]|uniref:Outer membrane lipoprotein carrier protein n=1 Tax=Mesonia maritima TaxID=1793873 RepID=A0ABU1K7R7_9FLAO|nr:outer membrane lipoprotein carrier protein LolA [Mesonia maritima]MDR6301666.1 outer membrane lipoprotein carrier protein [Mesonia maritima]